MLLLGSVLIVTTPKTVEQKTNYNHPPLPKPYIRSVIHIRIISTFFLCCFSLFGLTQQNIFPGLTGDELLQALQGSYTPDTVLEYGPARDTMYSRIDNVNDTVFGIYSQHGIYLPPGVPPREWLYKAGNPNGPGGVPDAINTEHTYPQSKGATKGTQAYSDMHHLFPSRLAVNEDRGSLPFGEIDDLDTEVWYYKNQEMMSIPTDNIDAYSEGRSSSFEPRESVKGNIARATFYFYTIYRQAAMNADPDFFENQREDLCQWHMLDPVDTRELNRSAEIAIHQAGLENPFVLDCSLAKRLYCPELSDSCVMVALSEISFPEQAFFKSYWNDPASLTVFYQSYTSEDIELDLIDQLGRVYRAILLENAHEGLNSWRVRMPMSMPSGMYILRLRFPEKPGIYHQRLIPLINP